MSAFIANKAVKQEVAKLHQEARTALNFAHSGDVSFTTHLLQQLERRLAKLAANIQLDSDC